MVATQRRLIARIAGIVLVLLLAFAPSPALAAAGRLDRTFGHGGRVITDMGGGVEGLALQPDGKLVAAGVAFSDQGPEHRFGVARYLPDGRLDPGFGSGGIVTTDMGRRNSWARAVALHSDGKIVVAGTVLDQHGSDGEFALARYEPNGTLDRTFGADGKVVHRFSSDHAGARGVAIQPDGKIVAVGRVHPAPLTDDFAVARYTSDGRLDPTFDDDGTVVTRFGEGDSGARGVVIRPDGRIVVGGYAGLSFALAQYLPEGTLDPSFGGDGMVTTQFPGIGTASALGLALEPGGMIVAVGVAYPGGLAAFALARYQQDGSLDPGFGGGGTVVTQFPGKPSIGFAVTIQPDGRIVAAGGANLQDIPPRGDFGLARYLPDGALDPAFGRDGLVATSLGAGTDLAHGVVIQPDGNIVGAGVGGVSRDRAGFALVRYEGA